MKNYVKSLLFLLILTNPTITAELPFVIVICSRNNAQWYKKNLHSACNQNYSNYRIIYIDDASIDQTGKLVQNYFKTHSHPPFIFKKNKKRRYKLHNLVWAVDLCQDHEIIVELDGDDWFSNSDTLSFLNKIYQEKSIWLTYGGIKMWPKKIDGVDCKPVPYDIIQLNKFRETLNIYKPFIALRSFYAGLFKKINLKDLKYKKKFFERGSDVITMLPILEMAGDKFYCIQKPIYIYNTDTEINDYTQDPKYQSLACFFAKHRRKYDTVSSLNI